MEKVLMVNEQGIPLDVHPKNGEAVTPSDSVNFDEPSTLFVGTSGDIVVVMWGNEEVLTFPAFSGWLPVLAKRVNSTNTTATNIKRFWY